jgi:hypothetical protein
MEGVAGGDMKPRSAPGMAASFTFRSDTFYT